MDEIVEFTSRIKKFYEEANKAQVNVKEVSLDGLKKVASIEKAIGDISSVMNEEDPLTILMAFAGDPVSVIKPLIEVIEKVEVEVTKAKAQIETKMDALGIEGFESDKNDRYANELSKIASCKEQIGRMVTV